MAQLHINLSILGVAFDEFAAGSHFIAHEHTKYPVGLCCAFDGYFFQCSVGWVHGGIPQLVGVHFTQTLVALDVDT